MVLWVAIVVIVSPSCVKIAPNRLSSSADRLHASAFAMAVMDAVSSQGVMKHHLNLGYDFVPFVSTPFQHSRQNSLPSWLRLSQTKWKKAIMQMSTAPKRVARLSCAQFVILI